MINQTRTINLGFTPERFSEGCHMCYIYNDEIERREVMARFIESGVADNEYTFYLVDSMPKAEMQAHLQQMGIHLPPAADEQRFSVLQAETTYCPDHAFSPDTMLDTLKSLYEQSVADGFAGCRGMGEMTWALRGIPGSERLVEYESRINIVVRTHPLTAICQYDAGRFDGATIFNILSVHPMMVVRGQVVKNPYYIPPEEFLARHAVVV